MTERQGNMLASIPDIPKKKRHRYITKTDTSPVSRLRYTQNEWKVILEAVGFYADFLAKEEWPKHRAVWLNSDYFVVHEADANSEKGKAWTFHTDKCGEIKTKVLQLCRIERQMQLHFGLIDPKIPHYQYTIQRVMH